jgi:TonB family protein
MSTSPEIDKNGSALGEQRSCPRKRLDSVVLVFFGQRNWGKLIDLNEKGMSIEFAHPPAMHELGHFTFEAMGCMIHTAGHVKWIREFERTAGVQFLDLEEKSQDQIRQWISPKSCGELDTLRDERISQADPEIAPSAVPETLAPSEGREAIVSAADVPNQLVAKTGDVDLTCANFDVEALQGWAPESVPQVPEVFGFRPNGELHREKSQIRRGVSEASRRWRRTGSMSALVCLAVFGFAAGIMLVHKPRGGRDAGGSAGSEGKVNAGQATERVTVRRPRPFVVEVLDTENRRWVLWFPNDAHQNASERRPYDLPLMTAPAIAKNGASAREKPAEQNPQMAHHFSLASPSVRQPGTNASAASSAPPVAPAVAGQTATPEMFAGIAGPAAPISPPIEKTPPMGGEVQPARLLRATKPVYPASARAYRVQGDVMLDAVIDGSGNPKEIKVISGPLLLREAAVEALRQWKYEPARLDGKPTAMRLTVTVEFRLN